MRCAAYSPNKNVIPVEMAAMRSEFQSGNPLIIGYICGFAPQLLSWWVGPEYMKLSPLMFLMLSHLVINLPVTSLFTVNVAYNKVRIPGIIIFFMGIGNFLLAVIIPYLTGWNFYGVALAGAIMLTLKNAFFTTWYATKILEISRTTFVNSMIQGTFAMLMTVGVSHIMAHYLHPSGIVHLIICGIFLTALYIFILWGFCLNQSEKEIASLYIPLKMRSILHLEA
jgi:membrane protein EpsK